MSHLHGTPSNIRINLTLSGSTTIALHFAAESIGLSSFNFSWWAPKTHVFLYRVRNGCSRSSKVIDFGTNRKRVCSLQLVINSNLGPILPRFRDIAGFLLRRSTPPGSPLFHPIFGVFPLDWIAMLWHRGTKFIPYRLIFQEQDTAVWVYDTIIWLSPCPSDWREAQQDGLNNKRSELYIHHLILFAF